MTRDSDTRRIAETGTGDWRPNGQSPNPIPSSDLDALVEKIEEAIEVHEGHCLSYVSFYPDTARRFATAITSLRNQLTASKARERETGAVILTLVQLVREYLPSDGISKDEFINRVLGVLDNNEMAELVGELEGRK